MNHVSFEVSESYLYLGYVLERGCPAQLGTVLADHQCDRGLRTSPFTL